MFMFMRLYCYEVVLSLILFDETILFQIFLLLSIVERKALFIGCYGNNIHKEHIWML